MSATTAPQAAPAPGTGTPGADASDAGARAAAAPAAGTTTAGSTAAGSTAAGAVGVANAPAGQGPWAPPPGAASGRPARPRRTAPPTPTAAYVARGALLALAVLLLGVAAQLVVLSPLQHRAAQASGFDRLRAELAEGTAPVGQQDADGKLVAPGSPLLLLTIPRLHLRQVVFEGTGADVLAKGPGHRRDTTLPGQAGTSVLMGRAAAYGGPFGHLTDLRPGDAFTVTTGQGTFHYRVMDFRLAGEPAPPLPGPGQGRLVLVSATGHPFLPEHVIRMDAELVGKAAPAPASMLAADSVPHDEQPFAGATPRWWELVLWLQALTVASIAAVWSWLRWGRHQSWIVFTPVVAVLGLQVADQITRLLPNLM